MKSKTMLGLLVLAILALAVAPVMAHGDEEHPPSDLERVVSGAGLLLVTLSAAFVFLTRGKGKGRLARKHKLPQANLPEWDD